MSLMGLPVSKWLLEKVTGIDRRRSMPRFSRGSFLRAGAKYLSACGPVADPVDKVAYFVDTYANFNDHELGFAVLDVLRHNGVEVILPAQRPSPLPAIVYGDVRLAKRDLAYSVKHLAQAVREGYKIVCSEPSAALCLREELRHYVGGRRRLARRPEHGGVDELPRGSATPRASSSPSTGSVGDKFVYHLPCHLGAVGDETVTLRLLQEHFGIDVADLRAGCCGLSGTFGMQQKNYELATQISESLKTPWRRPSTQNVLTECAACKMQIEHIAPTSTTHPIKLIARATACSGSRSHESHTSHGSYRLLELHHRLDLLTEGLRRPLGEGRDALLEPGGLLGLELADHVVARRP
jgi:Fe-S oxidoreductase